MKLNSMGAWEPRAGERRGRPGEVQAVSTGAVSKRRLESFHSPRGFTVRIWL
jgi:hypothetical protein